MHSSNVSGITSQVSISTASQTESNNNQQRLQNGNINNANRSTRTSNTGSDGGGSWRCEVFVDTPMTREFIQGPLNIQLPAIQLPSGLQNLVGQFTASGDEGGGGTNQQQYSLQRQTSLTIGDGFAAVSAFHHHNGEHQQNQNVQSPTNFPQSSSIPEYHQSSANIHQQHPKQKPVEMQSGGGPSSPTPSLASNWGRASSTPAAMNLNGGTDSANISPSNTNDSVAIDIDNIGAQTLDQNIKRVHRRRSSSPARPTQNSATHFVETIGGPSEPQLIQRTLANGHSNGTATDRTLSTGTTTTSVETTVDSAANTTNNSDGDEATFRNLRTRFQELLRRRHQIIRNIVQQTGEFPSLYALGVLASWLLVIIFVLIQFFAIEFTACLSLAFCLFHYSDVIAFKRYISGSGSGWMLISKIVLRQFMLLQLLGQSVFIFAASIFQPVSVNSLLIPNPSFWSTLYIVFITEYFIMDCVLCTKILVFNLPKCSTMYKRRLFQWLEYSAALYRFAIPFGQWNAYLNAMWWTVLYGGMKILLALSMAWGWLLTTLRIFRATHLGSAPSEADCKKNEPCTICFSEFTSPIKLKCGHIFCSECIRTWLDREHTCPICRAVVTKEDNNYRNGESMFPSLF